MTAPQPPQNAQRQQADTAELARRNQQRAADPRRSVWVSASAGSGKTKVLTDRVLRLLLNGVAPQRLLALTFSKAGAAEMANRVNARLAHWAVMAPAVLESDLRGLGEPGDAEQCRRARRLFARVLDLPAGLAIETIHAFCQRLLGRFPLEAGVAANFSVIDEVEGNRLLAEARDSLLVSAQRDGGDAARWVAEVALHSAEDQFTTLLGNLLGARQRLRDWITGLGGPAQLEAHFAARLGLDIAGAGGTHSDAALIQQFLTQEDQAWPELRRLVTACEAAPTKRVTDHLAPLLAWRERNDRDRAATLGDYTGFFLKSGSIEPYSIGHMLPKKAREAQPEIVQTYLSRAAACQALRLEQNKRDLLRCNVALFRLADAMISRFEQKKAASAQLDFDDLIAKTEALLRQPGGSAWVSFKLDSAISHVLVDESQDTNDPQWRIIEALTAEFFAGSGQNDGLDRSDRPLASDAESHLHALPRSLFVVGDRKQSIFSFQGADPERFDAMRQQFGARAQAGGLLWETVSLDISFRSTPEVLQAVDSTFAPPELANGLIGPRIDPAPADLAGRARSDWPGHLAHRHDAPGLVQLLPLLRPDKAAGEQRAGCLDRLAEAVAALVEQLVTSGDAAPQDIMILLKNRRPLAHRLLQALQRRGLPVAGLDRLQLSDELLYQDLMALTRFVLFPDDDLSLAEVLRGPFCGLDEAALFELARERPDSQRLWSRLRDSQQHPEVLAFLTTALSLADYAPAFEFYSQILETLGGRQRLISAHGAGCDDALNEFLNQVLDHEQEGAPGLEAFAHWARSARLEIKRDSEPGDSAQLRIMTAHGSKGLQAPVVILPDSVHAPVRTSRVFWSRDGAFWLPTTELAIELTDQLKQARAASDREESARLAYVAMTRAEDRLYVFGACHNDKHLDDSWYSWIERGLLAAGAQRTDAQGLLLVSDRAAAPPVAPGSASVLPKQRIADEGEPAWLHRAPLSEPRPPRPLTPSTEAETDQEPVLPPPGAGGLVAAADSSVSQEQQRFLRGQLTHHLLQHLPSLPVPERAVQAAAYLDQVAADASPALRQSIAGEVLSLLDSPDAAPLFDARSRAEVPLTALVGDRVIAGRVDRLRLLDDEVWIVDYKTNRPPPTTIDRLPRSYQVQMAAYAQALSAIFPQHRPRAFILWTDGARLMELPPEMLTLPALEGPAASLLA